MREKWRKEVAALHVTVIFYEHETGAEIIHVKNDDPNRCFAVSFQTIPTDDSGVAHILEHSVLAGSQKYPVKDPFVQLVKSSQKTYVNASTYPDRTNYPVSSQNTEDFKNLMSVYLDAVFAPLLTENTLKQEGWRYDLTENTPLQFKGVVYNEMKGAYSNVDGIIEDTIYAELFPNTCYAKASGGDPAKIPTLTIDALRLFHSSQYTASNAKIYFYGDMDVAQYMPIVEEYLQTYKKVPMPNRAVLQKTFQKTTVVEKDIPVSKDKLVNGGVSVFAWGLGDEVDPFLTQKERVAWEILSYLLLSSDASPFKKELLESGLGESVFDGGLELSLYQPYFYFGLRNITNNDFAKVESFIQQLIVKQIKEGLSDELLSSALNKLEFEFREISNEGHYPRNIAMFVTMLQSWSYGRDPLENLDIEESIEALRNEVANHSDYFVVLLQKRLVDNPHKVIFRFKPSSTYIDERNEEENKRLAQLYKSFSLEYRQQLIQETNQFNEYQKQGDDEVSLKKLPKLEVKDLDKKIATIPTEVRSGEITVLSHSLTTNGIVYTDFVFDIAHLTSEEKTLASVLSDCLFRLGTQSYSPSELSLKLDSVIGGFGSGFLFRERYDNAETVQKFIVSIKYLGKYQADVHQLLSQVLSFLDLSDEPLLDQLVLESKAEEEASLVQSGYAYALQYAKALVNKTTMQSQYTSGIKHVQWLNQFALFSKQQKEEFYTALRNVYKKIFTKENIVVNITADAALIDESVKEVSRYLEALPVGSSKSLREETEVAPRSIAVVLPVQVSYQGMSIQFESLQNLNKGTLFAINKYLNTGYLWQTIRQLGGAYGGGMVVDIAASTVSFYSYRDPNVKETYETFSTIPKFLASDATLSQRDIDDCVISSMAMLDAPLTSGEKGSVALERYLVGLTDEGRQQLRDELFATGIADFASFGELLKSSLSKKSAKVSLLSTELLEKNRELFEKIENLQ